MAMSLYGQLDSKISTNLNISDLVKTISDLLFTGRFLVSLHCKSQTSLEGRRLVFCLYGVVPIDNDNAMIWI